MSKLDQTSIDEIKGKDKSDEDKQDKKKSNKKFKSRKGNKGDRKFDKKGTNDPSWYVANPSIVKDVASLPFAVFNGITYENFKTNEAAAVPSTVPRETLVPGIAIYKYMPWYGTATPTSALNLTMRALYSFVRHANSGRANYEAPDLMLYIMAMDQIYLMIHEIKRLIRLAYLYVLENRDIPEKVYQSMGIDLSDVVGNLANYRAQLNVRIAKANSLAVPANFNLFKRRAVMGSVVLTDEPNRPTQIIVPKADGYYQYDATGTTGGQLVYVSPKGVTTPSQYTNSFQYNGVREVAITLKNYLTLLDQSLGILLADEDINIMSGDIIKAYGDNLYRLPFLAENEVQEITHDENLLLQFSNSTVLDVPFATYNLREVVANVNTFVYHTNTPNVYSNTPIITQANGSLIAKCSANGLESYRQVKARGVNGVPLITLDNQFIDTTNASSITPENVMEWTRLMMTTRRDNEILSRYTLEAGVEIGLGWQVLMPLSKFGPDTSTSNIWNNYVIVQWYQFGSLNPENGKLITPTYNSVTGFNYTYYYCIETAFDDTLTGVVRKYNTYYAQQFIEGLSFGPRAYNVYGINLAENTPPNVYVDGSISKLGEKTAIAYRENIVSMHDAALLGLISSPYVTMSK